MFEFILDHCSELPAFEHPKLWCLQTLCWLPGERLLPMGLLVLSSADFFKFNFLKNSFRNTIRVSNSLDPDQVHRPPDKSAYWKTIFLIQNMMWILNEHPKYMFKLIGKKIITILRSNNVLIWTNILGRVAQSVTCLATDACLTADPGVASLIPARSHTFVEIDHEIISTVILLPSADSFKKGCCQLQAKVCAQING